ncbi:MAG: erythrose-4-phosphate dehydrogenase [Desulfuromonadales bacterium]|nr:erythrose-4-phosphate dehydrogenase [Desulfuromonadales bacterium]MBN2790899.1 erythrose-4-phosphate dehydrogenase [Desulfuromonadales bacterium]
MSYRIAINGYGRIGQSVLRALYTNQHYHDLKVVAINELADLETLTYLTRYDTTHGRFPVAVKNDGSQLLINGDAIKVFNEQQPENLPWEQLGIDLVCECSGSYTDRATAEKHLESGAGKLLFSQPADDNIDVTVVFGFNHAELKADHKIVSNASCTTNCVVPVLNLLDQHFGITNGVSTTIHSVMNDQPVIDRYHQSDLRLTRSAMHSMIPVETGLSLGIAKFLPHLRGKIECLHLRVPTINVSLMDLAINLRTPTDSHSINALFKQASSAELAGLVGYSEEPHASVDFNTDSRSAVVDGTQTRVSDGQLVKLMVWFDNEWSYANRMLDVAGYWLSR